MSFTVWHWRSMCACISQKAWDGWGKTARMSRIVMYGCRTRKHFICSVIWVYNKHGHVAQGMRWALGLRWCHTQCGMRFGSTGISNTVSHGCEARSRMSRTVWHGCKTRAHATKSVALAYGTFAHVTYGMWWDQGARGHVSHIQTNVPAACRVCMFRESATNVSITLCFT